jgi:DNA-binding response OmpR family regulator
MKTILVIEDEEDILDLLEYHLSKEGYDVISCIDTQNVKNILDEESISAVLMDRNLPGVEGSEYVLKLREQGYDFPLIFISAKNSSNDILDGFKSGADDYITKPFNIDELKARVKALIKRSSKEQDILKYRDITYNATNKTFYIEDKKVKLTQLEHDLFLEFFKNKNILLSREVLLEKVWRDGANKKLKTVNVAIKRLKENIDPDGSKNYIEAIRGEGYIFC